MLSRRAIWPLMIGGVILTLLATYICLKKIENIYANRINLERNVQVLNKSIENIKFELMNIQKLGHTKDFNLNNLKSKTKTINGQYSKLKKHNQQLISVTTLKNIKRDLRSYEKGLAYYLKSGLKKSVLRSLDLKVNGIIESLSSIKVSSAINKESYGQELQRNLYIPLALNALAIIMLLFLMSLILKKNNQLKARIKQSINLNDKMAYGLRQDLKILQDKKEKHLEEIESLFSKAIKLLENVKRINLELSQSSIQNKENFKNLLKSKRSLDHLEIVIKGIVNYSNSKNETRQLEQKEQQGMIRSLDEVLLKGQEFKNLALETKILALNISTELARSSAQTGQSEEVKELPFLSDELNLYTKNNTQLVEELAQGLAEKIKKVKEYLLMTPTRQGGLFAGEEPIGESLQLLETFQSTNSKTMNTYQEVFECLSSQKMIIKNHENLLDDFIKDIESTKRSIQSSDYQTIKIESFLTLLEKESHDIKNKTIKSKKETGPSQFIKEVS